MASSESAEQIKRTKKRDPRTKGNQTIIEVDEEDSNQVSEVEIIMSLQKSIRPGRRKEESKVLDKTDPMQLYEHACVKLQLSAIPDELPCRDKERKIITDYIENGLRNKGSSSSLFISGMPGTGKTATTLAVIDDLKERRKFAFLHINAMQITNPNVVYTIICESITGQRLNPASAALFLDEFFKKKDKTKLLLDKWARTHKD